MRTASTASCTKKLQHVLRDILTRTNSSGQFITSVLAVLFAFLIGAAIIRVSGYSPLRAYGALIQGSFGSIYDLSQTLANATPLIFTGLAVALAFQAGVFNIGGEGQLYVGGFAAALVGIYVTAPLGIPLILAIVVGAAAGGLWAFIPGYLKARWNAPEVVNTIMMNSVGMLLVDYFLRYHFQGPGVANETVRVSPGAVLPRVFEDSQLSYGLFLALLAAVAVWYILSRTAVGYELRAAGLNPDAAEYAGINVARNAVITLVLSGALAGTGGAVTILGVYNRFVGNFSGGYGFDGIAVALLARNNPFVVVLTAILFGAMRTGGMAMDRVAHMPVDLVSILLGLIVCFVAAPDILRALSHPRQHGGA